MRKPKPRITGRTIVAFSRSSSGLVSRVAKQLGFRSPFTRWQAKMILERIYRAQGRMLCQGMLPPDEEIDALGVKVAGTKKR